MSGNQIETERAGPEDAGWAPTTLWAIQAIITETVLYVADDKPKSMIDADRRARAALNLARAVKAVEASRQAPRRPAAQDDLEEDRMDEAHHDDPDRVAALQHELAGRIDRIRAQIELKRAGRHADDGTGPRARDPGDAEDGAAPGPAAGGLDDLGPAGWTGIGQDLRGRLLAA